MLHFRTSWIYLLAGIWFLHTGSARNINLGLDLAGGVSITYQAKDKNPSAEDMKDTIYKLQKRVEQYSTEASVYQEGDDRINIEIPGVSDANKVLEELGKPGSLVFQDADGNTVLEGTDVKNAEAQTQENSTTKNKRICQLLCSLPKKEQPNLQKQQQQM